MAEFSIRFAEIDDCPVVFELIQSLAEYEKLSHEVVGSVEKLEENLFISHAYAEALLAEIEGEAVGFALFFHTFSTFLCKPGLYLEDLFVKEEFRGNGIGLALISGVGKVARDRGCGRVEWSVLDWNTPSIEFYESLQAVKKVGWNLMRVTGESLEGLADASSVDIQTRMNLS